MPVPTDQLAAQTKDLRESDARLADEIKKVFERLSSEMQQSNRQLTETISKVATEFQNFRIEIIREAANVRASSTQELQKFQERVTEKLEGINKTVGDTNEKLGSFQGSVKTGMACASFLAILACGIAGWALKEQKTAAVNEGVLQEQVRELRGQFDHHVYSSNAAQPTALRPPLLPDGTTNSNIEPPPLPGPAPYGPAPEKKQPDQKPKSLGEGARKLDSPSLRK